MAKKTEKMVGFGSGATRSDPDGKPDFSGFLSPWMMRLFGRYMTKHQVQADGALRKPNNWKKGMPMPRYMASLSRHVRDLNEAWDRLDLYNERTPENADAFEEALGGVIFNANGLAHEWERAKEEANARTDKS